MCWNVELYPLFAQEFLEFSEAVQDALLAEVAMLEKYGPLLNRPHVDTLNGSKHTNMKELRFSFDPVRGGEPMTKGKILQSIWDNLPDERKQRIQARTEELETEYLTLQELRLAAGLTQAEISRSLQMPQSNVSRLERESDMLLSTLRKYIDAMGGNLTITVELPNKPPVRLNTLSDLISS